MPSPGGRALQGKASRGLSHQNPTGVGLKSGEGGTFIPPEEGFGEIARDRTLPRKVKSPGGATTAQEECPPVWHDSEYFMSTGLGS